MRLRVCGVIRLLRPTLAREDYLQYLRKRAGALRTPACDLFACSCRTNTCLLALVSCGRDVVFPHIAWPLLRIGAPCKPQWPTTSAYGTRMTSKASRRCTPRPPLSPTGMQHTVRLRHLYSCTHRVRPRG
eukprot:scaffold102320_cov57-Phaeocystis_antarctica.AAC.1